MPPSFTLQWLETWEDDTGTVSLTGASLVHFEPWEISGDFYPGDLRCCEPIVGDDVILLNERLAVSGGGGAYST